MTLMDEWIKEIVIYTYISHCDIYIFFPKEYYSATEEKEILPSVAAWMDLLGILLSKISQTEKDKSHMILLIFVH